MDLQLSNVSLFLGQRFGTKSRRSDKKNQVKTDPFSGIYHTYVPLQNIDAFYEAFGLKRGRNILNQEKS
jgi:predicted metalloendopeptidase